MFSLPRPSLCSSRLRCVVLDHLTTARAAVHHHQHNARASAAAAARTYISRAHPKPIPQFPIIDAIQMVLDDVAERRKKRERKEFFYKQRMERAKEKPSKLEKHIGKTIPPWTRGHPDETIELALNLNLDPRKPGQALRGSVTLPHGTGKQGPTCVVFTSDPAVAERARAAGATHAGGEDLVDQIVQGDIPVDTLQASVATQDIMPVLTQKAARLLGPRRLMPNVKVGTLVETAEELIAAVQTQVSGNELIFRTDNDGIVHAAVGKYSFGPDKLLENLGAVVQALYDIRPDSYGKGKQKKAAKKGQALKKSQPQYVLRAHVCSTQSKSVRVDLRTVDPNGPFFLRPLDPLAPAAPSSSTSNNASSSDDDDVAA